MRHTPARGFTLIEMVVSVGLFAIVMMMATGGYLEMIGVTRQAQAQATAADNLAFALETMARTIRTGSAYSCGQSGGACPSVPQSYFSFTDVNGTPTVYELATGATCGSSGGCLVEVLNNDGVPHLLTDPSINLTSLKFYLSDATQNNAVQPQVTLSLSGTIPAGANAPPASFTLETGATMRGLDIGP